MSGRKNFLVGFKLISQGDMSQAIVTSNPESIQGLDNIYIQYNITTGTPSGTFSIQVSGDYNQNLGTGNWITLLQPGTTTPVQIVVTSGSPANGVFDLNQISLPWYQLVYTKTSGTGNFDAVVGGKML